MSRFGIVPVALLAAFIAVYGRTGGRGVGAAAARHSARGKRPGDRRNAHRRSVEIGEAPHAGVGSAPQGGARAADRRVRDRRRSSAVRRVRREADRRDRREPAHRRRRLRHRRRSASRLVAGRPAGFSLSLHRDAAGHALPALQRERRIRTEVAERRQAAAGRLHGHDAHPVRRDARRRARELADPVRAVRAEDRRPAGVGVRGRPVRSQRRRVRRHAERPLGQRRGRASPAADRAVQRGRSRRQARRRHDDALGRGPLDPDHAHGVVRRDDPSRFLERRTRPAVDLADGVPPVLQRGAAVLRADAERHQPVRLRGVPGHHRALHARDPDAQARLRAGRLARIRHVQRLRLRRRPPHRQRASISVAQRVAHGRHRLPRRRDVRAGLRRPAHHRGRLRERPQAQGRVRQLRLGPRHQRARQRAGAAHRRWAPRTTAPTTTSAAACARSAATTTPSTA